MKRIGSLVIISLILVILGGYIPVYAKGPVALVAGVKGNARLSRAGSKKTATLSMLEELSPGDKLFLGKNTEIRITFYKDTHSEVLKGQCIVEVSGNSIKLLKGSPSSIKVIPAYKGIKTLQSIKASSLKYGGTAARKNYIFIHAPRRIVTTTRPTFKWEPLGRNQTYHISLEDRNGRKICDLSTKDNVLEYPGDISSLEHGKAYFFIVSRNKPFFESTTSRTAFQVIDERTDRIMKELKAQVEKQLKENPRDPGPGVVLLTFYLQNNIIEEAFNTCDKILRKDPGNKNIRKLMKELQGLRGMSDRVKKEYFDQLDKR